MATHIYNHLQRYHDDIETVEKDEPETAKAISDTMLSIAYKTYGNSGHAIRSVHAKSHGILTADLEILSDLPQPLAQGLFAHAGRHPVIIRLSSTPGDILHDSVSTPRGMSIKVLDVDGEHLDGDRATTQDFVMVNGKQFNAKSAKAFLKSLKLLAVTTDHAEGLKKIASKAFRGIEAVLEAVGGESATLKSLGGHPETHILGESFFGQMPIRYGDYVAKIAIVPVAPELRALTDQPLDINHDHDGLRHAVSEFFAANDAVWDVQIQLCSSVDEMPIEDAQAVWDETISPFVTVARLTARAQASWQGEASEAMNDSLGFRPWNALVAHRPLGSIMRMRKLAYRQSQDFRSQRNPVPVSEPGDADLSETAGQRYGAKTA